MCERRKIGFSGTQAVSEILISIDGHPWDSSDSQYGLIHFGVIYVLFRSFIWGDKKVGVDQANSKRKTITLEVKQLLFRNVESLVRFQVFMLPKFRGNQFRLQVDDVSSLDYIEDVDVIIVVPQLIPNSPNGALRLREFTVKGCNLEPNEKECYEAPDVLDVSEASKLVLKSW